MCAEKTKSNAVIRWEKFESGLSSRADGIATQLPKNIDKDRFFNSALAAVKQTPDLLECTQRSLFAAITKSAQDGLLPDGREGVITKYKGKKGVEASWNPMVWGLRKRARELDDIIIDAQVVYAADHFQRCQGDLPAIEHIPADLTDKRGDIVGAYAIIRKGDTILHREVMNKEDIERVRAQSKAPNSLMWSKFTGEGYKKVVVRRGIKSVPCSLRLEEIIHRDDELYDMETPKDITPPSAPPAPEISDDSNSEGTTPPSPEGAGDAPQEIEGEFFDPDNYLNHLEGMLNDIVVGDLEGLKAARDYHISVIDNLFPPDIEKAEAMFDKHAGRVEEMG